MGKLLEDSNGNERWTELRMAGLGREWLEGTSELCTDYQKKTKNKNWVSCRRIHTSGDTAGGAVWGQAPGYLVCAATFVRGCGEGWINVQRMSGLAREGTSCDAVEGPIPSHRDGPRQLSGIGPWVHPVTGAGWFPSQNAMLDRVWMQVPPGDRKRPWPEF